jgi:hypothetical protein
MIKSHKKGNAMKHTLFLLAAFTLLMTSHMQASESAVNRISEELLSDDAPEVSLTSEDDASDFLADVTLVDEPEVIQEVQKESYCNALVFHMKKLGCLCAMRLYALKAWIEERLP